MRSSITATVSVASRTAGSAAPFAPLSIVLRMVFTSSIRRATSTLNLVCSTSAGASDRSLCVVRRSAASPPSKTTSTGLETSRAMRSARDRNFWAPVVETSAQSLSSSTGPANARPTRSASAPCASSSSWKSTRLPLLFDIFWPSSRTMPWLIRFENGSVKSISPMSNSTFVMKRAYSRCRIACSTPPM